ncbi:MAG: exodeoxyribonuclease III [Pseudomonadota bacterium]
MFKIATWNVNSLKVRLEQVLDWCQQHQPDVLALQETKLTDENFPVQAITQSGYQVVFSGQKTYNGVAILTQSPPKDTQSTIPNFTDPQKRILVTTVADVRIINLYVPNGQSVDSEKFQYKLDWLQKVTQYIAAELKQYSKLVVLGDFNIAPQPEDVHTPQAWQGQVLFSQPERDVFQNLINLGLQDSFRLFDQPEKIYSWWDYRQLALQKNHGLRIDHILITPALAENCKAVYIDKKPRKLKRPSDHAPVVAEFEI